MFWNLYYIILCHNTSMFLDHRKACPSRDGFSYFDLDGGGKIFGVCVIFLLRAPPPLPSPEKPCLCPSYLPNNPRYEYANIFGAN